MAATYKAQIRARWDWPAVEQTARSDAGHLPSGCSEGCDATGHIGSTYLGTVINNYPSGKIWTIWTTNQTPDDERRDSAFHAAFAEVAESFGGSIESGEGDPNDLYFVRFFGNDEVAACPVCHEYLKDTDIAFSYILDTIIHVDCLIDSGEVG